MDIVSQTMNLLPVLGKVAGEGNMVDALRLRGVSCIDAKIEFVLKDTALHQIVDAQRVDLDPKLFDPDCQQLLIFLSVS